VLKQQALQTAKSCNFGDFTAIELFNHTQAAFLIGMVVGEVVVVERTIENWSGTIKQGSKGVSLQRLQPTVPGSLCFYLTDDKLVANCSSTSFPGSFIWK
jgi:pantothenate kinase type III